MKAKNFWAGLAGGVLGVFITLVVVFSFFAKKYEVFPGKKNEETGLVQENKSEKTSSALAVSNTAQAPRLMQAPFDFRDIIRKTKDAVVHVRNTQIVVPTYEWFYGYRQGQPYKQEGTGSGVIISPDGYIVTNYHVIKNASELEVTLNNKKTYPAQIVGVDAQNDIAVIKIPATDLTYMEFGDSSRLELGEWVLAIGNPFNLGTTVTAGIVSAKARDIKGNHKIDSFIQTDAVINPGNSGGALINEKGELVGINTMIFSLTGSYIGYSFAIPSNIVRKIANDIIEYGSIQKAKIGVSGYELNDQIARKLGIDRTEGIWVSDVDRDSDSYQKGLRPGDIIIGVNDQKVSTMSQFLEYLKSKEPGSKLLLKIIKPGGKQKVLPVVLQKNDTAYVGNWGMLVKNLTRKELRKRGLENGVLIAQINNRELLANGIEPGFIITKINDVPVYTADDVVNTLHETGGRTIVEMQDNHGQTVRYIFR